MSRDRECRKDLVCQDCHVESCPHALDYNRYLAAIVAEAIDTPDAPDDQDEMDVADPRTLFVDSDEEVEDDQLT